MKNISSIQNRHRWAQILFLVLPTFVVAAFLLWQSNSFYTILRNQWITQSLYFGSGLVLGSLLFSGRLRFITSFGLLVLGLFIAYRFIDQVAVGEFDAVFISQQFLMFSFLFSIGVFLGWGLQRYAYFSIIVSSFFFLLSIYLLSKTGEFTMGRIVLILLPIIIYCIYLIFTSNELYRFKVSNSFSWTKLLIRLLVFFGFILIIGTGVLLFMKVEIQTTIEQYGNTQTNNENSMLKKNKDGTVKNQDKMGMRNNNKRSNELVFCAYIDNFFEGTEIPSPLYLTSHYFTQFDTLTETFERDRNMPFKDEFTPNPNEIPLFSKERDLDILDSAMSSKDLQEVEIEVYKKRLAADAFVAPNTAYEVQPITVEKDFQEDYYYAYRAKSRVSKLNSAYFIYNTDDPMISTFQEQRFKELRTAKTYEKVDNRFLDYYTFYPSARKFRNFKVLADSLSKANPTTIDKILAIRSYFKQKNPLGEAVYSYSDNPGIPGLPGASKLSTFMFQTKKGWCTYYAGSTLLMLRAMKIPSRIAVGFLTIDRSDNNKGWYWFYQDQAHAWVQVYFPEYGWLDFDMTIGNDEAQEAKTPDGTPPMQPPKAVVVVGGEIKTMDTLNKNLDVQSNHFIYKDNEFSDINESVSIDVSEAKIWRDSTRISMSDLQKTDYIISVSYNEKLGAYRSKKIAQLLKRLPDHIPVDEVYLKTKKIKNNEEESIDDKKPQSVVQILTKFLIFLLVILLLIFAMPYLILKIYAIRFKKGRSPREQSYRLFRYTTYYLNQMGYAQNSLTLSEFAQQTVEPKFANQYEIFARHYQKIKFSEQSATQLDVAYVTSYFSTFTQNLKRKIPAKERFVNFLRLKRTFKYFLSYSNN